MMLDTVKRLESVTGKLWQSSATSLAFRTRFVLAGRHCLGCLVLAAICFCTASFLGCDRGANEKAAGFNRFSVATNSMAPAIYGKYHNAVCGTCQRSFKVAAETLDTRLPCHCLSCGSPCEIRSKQSLGTAIQIESSDTRLVERFDVLAFRGLSASFTTNPAANALKPTRPVLKRVWGLPGERLETARGELWVDGRMIRKPFHILDQVQVPLGILAVNSQGDNVEALGDVTLAALGRQDVLPWKVEASDRSTKIMWSSKVLGNLRQRRQPAALLMGFQATIHSESRSLVCSDGD